jgi:hypothetical protein
MLRDGPLCDLQPDLGWSLARCIVESGMSEIWPLLALFLLPQLFWLAGLLH